MFEVLVGAEESVEAGSRVGRVGVRVGETTDEEDFVRDDLQPNSCPGRWYRTRRRLSRDDHARCYSIFNLSNVVLSSSLVSVSSGSTVKARFLVAEGYEMGWLKRLGRDAMRLIAALAGLRITDPTSGFQAMNRSVLELFASDFFPSDYPDVDVLMVASRHGLRIGERPVRMSPSPRISTMHAGLSFFYYAYKMLLSIFTALWKR